MLIFEIFNFLDFFSSQSNMSSNFNSFVVVIATAYEFEIPLSLKNLKVPLYATNGTAQVLMQELDTIKHVSWDEAEKLIDSKKIDCVINTPTHARVLNKKGEQAQLTEGQKLRRRAVDRNIPLITDAQLAESFIEALIWKNSNENEIKGWDEY